MSLLPGTSPWFTPFSGSGTSPTPPPSGVSQPVATPSNYPFYVFSVSVSVVLTASEGAVIYFTLDGTIPDTGSRVYSEPLVFTDNIKVTTIAVLDGNSSEHIAYNYVRRI